MALVLFKIFLEFGAPHFLQSINGHGFVTGIIQELIPLWLECKIVHRHHPHHPETQESVERSNQDVKNMFRGWMQDSSSTM